jgi:ribosomal protein S12 methylthiotransferase accessory factor
VPYDSVHLNFTVGFDQHESGLVVSSNGLASGNHLLEAISHAICEAVERDATALWYLADENTRAATRVDLATVRDPARSAVLEQFERAGVGVGVWEITSDIGIPAFLCRAVDAADHALRRRCFNEAMGCHPSRSIGLLRALVEAAQSRLTWIAGARDDCYPEHYVAMRDADLNERQRDALAAPGPRRPFAGPDWQTDTFDADLIWELERLRDAGIERVVVVDLTRPELRIPVVRVVIPGLEGLIAGGYVPGPRARARIGAAP